MYKELGFNKTAAPVWLQGVGKAIKGDKAATANILDKVKHGRKFVSNLSDEAMAGAEGIFNPMGWKSPRQLQSLANKVTTQVKKNPMRSLAVGVGVGAVGATAVSSVFGSKKRNSPYYPY